MCLPSMIIAWTWIGSVCPQWPQLRSSDECVCSRWWLPRLEVDLYALSDRSHEAQMKVVTLDDDCLDLKWICVPSMTAATKLRWMCLPSMMIAWPWSGSVCPSMIAATKLRWTCLPWMMIAWTWSGSVCLEWSQLSSSDRYECLRWRLPPWT